MFLMNASPLVALQPKWEPFSHSRSFRYPICFSESEDDIARTGVSTKVQLIINNLQSEEVSVSSGDHEYRHIMQTKQKDGKSRDSKTRSNARTLQECLGYPQYTCPADSDGMEVEESSEFGPLSVNSDSDASVDRDIEEAIQEYLKNKVSLGGQPLASKTKSSSTRDGENPTQQEHPFGNPLVDMLHANVKTEVTLDAPERLEFSGTPWALSPGSASSDDSFEQSIKAEIEQFLNEKKKQQAKRRRSGSGQNETREPKGSRENPAVQSQKEVGSRAGQLSLGTGGASLCFRRHSELQDTHVAQRLKSKPRDRFEDVKTTRRAQFRTSWAGRSLTPEESKEDTRWPEPEKDGGEVKLEDRDGSDSSSDDGIEEAIQLYQRERIRKAADSRREGVPFRDEVFRASGADDAAAVLRVRSVESALSGTPKKMLSPKRKRALSKPPGLDQSSTLCRALREDKCRTPAGRTAGRCAATLRAGTATELMCAEAILDISKAILPPRGERDHGLFTAASVFSSPNVQMLSDSSTVDSDDSIEQEIRGFLAVKAQRGNMVARSQETSGFLHVPSLGQSDEQARSPKSTLPKPLKMPLSRQRRSKGGSKASPQSLDTPLIKSEMDCSFMDDKNSKISASQQENGGSRLPGVKVEGDAPAALSSIAMANAFPQRQLSSRNTVKNATRNQPKHGAGDKSSSLDSDEDLDTAIKDLLRSKRKQKKKGKEPRIQCKKKVCFGEAERHLLVGGGRASQSQVTPALLRSCLVGDKRETQEGNTKKETQILAKGQPKEANEVRGDSQMKQFPELEIHGNPWTGGSLTEESSSVDSDDSIEQEIQKFLAEKAKDATCSVHAPRSSKDAEAPEMNKPQNSLPKVKGQALKGQGRCPPKQRRKGEKMEPSVIELGDFPRPRKDPVGNASSEGKLIVSPAERMCGQAAAMLPAQENVGLIGERAAVETTVVWKGWRGPWDLQPRRKADAEDRRLQSYFTPLKRKDVCEFKISSKFITALKSAQTKKKSVLWGGRQNKEFALPKKLSGSAASEVWSGRCDLNPQQRASGCGKKAGVGNGELLPRFSASVPDRTLNIQVAPSHKAMESPLGVEGPGEGANSGQGFPLEGAGLDGVGGVGFSTQGVRVMIRSGEEHMRHWREGNSPRELPTRENPGFGPERAAEEQTPKAFEGNSAEFNDRSMVE